MKIITLKEYKKRIVANLYEVKLRRAVKQYIKDKFFQFLHTKAIESLMENSKGTIPLMGNGIGFPNYGYDNKPYAPPIPKQEVERPGIGSTQIPIIFKSRYFNDKEPSN